MTTFTPWASLAGGALIGLAAVLLMATHGRILGVSGMLGRLLPPYEDDGWQVRAALVAGILAAPLVAPALGLSLAQTVGSDVAVMIAGGLLVGLGSTLGSGCTSGHGVCGLSRFSLRSLVATLVFMAIAIATVFLTRHVLALGG